MRDGGFKTIFQYTIAPFSSLWDVSYAFTISLARRISHGIELLAFFEVT